MKLDTKKISKILGNKTNLEVMLCLSKGEKSFNKIKKECKVCSPSLTYSIKILLKENVIKKRAFHKRKIYSLTRRGESLLKIIKKIKI
ncbi:MAG: winged helix-turn-helix domain-containing protein [Candidatus Aenigmatarchaeota archaeon]